MLVVGASECLCDFGGRGLEGVKHMFIITAALDPTEPK
jgi:hypothetical protein